MKIITTIAFFFAFFSLKSMEIGINQTVFQTSDGQSYLEVQIEISDDGSIFHFIDTSKTKMHSRIEALFLIKNGLDVVVADKFSLESPIVDLPIPVLDVRRFALKNGKYTLEIQFTDLLLPTQKQTYSVEFEVNSTKNALFCSNPVLLAGYHAEAQESAFTKNGYFLEPLPFRFFSRNTSQLLFYQEINNSDKQPADEYLVRYFIEKVDENGKTTMVDIGNRRCKPSPMEVLLVQMDITKLNSGHYRLVVEMRNRQNEILSTKSVDFERSNPFLDSPILSITQEMADNDFLKDFTESELRYALRALTPKLDADESGQHSYILKEGILPAMRLFLFNFWVKQSPGAPKIAFDQYMDVARAVDQQFKSAVGFGFETDRGYRIIKYGKPTDILTVDDEPNAPPYEIWIYNSFPFTRQTNIKFLFYNPSLAPGDYVMLTSNARGEVNNRNWQRILYKSSPNDFSDNDNLDGDGQVKSNVNRRAAEYFADF
jgi:GWxTD domain-containing protein